MHTAIWGLLTTKSAQGMGRNAVNKLFWASTIINSNILQVPVIGKCVFQFRIRPHSVLKWLVYHFTERITSVWVPMCWASNITDNSLSSLSYLRSPVTSIHPPSCQTKQKSKSVLPNVCKVVWNSQIKCWLCSKSTALCNQTSRVNNTKNRNPWSNFNCLKSWGQR